MKKSTKVELVSAVAMLLVAAMMMTSASFAWFTLSTTPEVSNLEVSLGVSKNFEIAGVNVDGTNWVTPDEVTSADAINDEYDRTWGSKVTTFPGMTADNTINYGIKIADGTTVKDTAGNIISSGALTQIAYAEDSRTSGAYIKLDTTPSAMVGGVQTIAACIAKTGTTPTVTKSVAAGYGVWLRSNTTVSSITVTIATEDAVAAYYDYVAGTQVSNQDYLPTTMGAAGTASNSYAVGDNISVAVRLYEYYPTANTTNEWMASFEADTEDERDDYDDDEYPYISLAAGTTTDLEDYDDFVMKPNTIYMAVITVSIDGEYVYARSFTGNGMTISGFDVTFSSTDVN